MFSRRRAGTAKLDEIAGQRAHRPDYQIVLFIGLLMLVGLVIMYAIGPQRANVMNSAHNTDYYTDTYFVIKQVWSLALAIGAFLFASKIPFSWFKKYALTILQAGLALCGLLFIFGNIFNVDAVAVNTLGAYRWFKVGSYASFQPAEFLKFGLLLYLAVFLSARASKGLLNDTQKTITPVVVIALVSLLFVVVIQKDLGTGIAIGSIVASILMVSGVDKKIGLKLLMGVVVLGVLAIAIAPHRMERIATFFGGIGNSSTAATDDDSSYHIRNAMIAIGTGGLFGRGIGNSIQATGYLPEAINDSVFAILGEMFGLVGVCVILGIFTVLLMRLLKITDRLPDMSMRLVVAGVFGWLAAHVILNVASMIGVMPLTGITLPLLSFGGTSMLFISGAMGLAFQLSKYTNHTAVVTREAAHENISSRRGIGRTRVAGRRAF